MVFGIISERIKIAIVIIADTIQNELPSSPKTFSACTPTKMAPTVCAMVFTVRIAISGLSISFLKLLRVVAKDFPSFFLILIKVGVMLNSTASKIEHINEKKIASVAYKIRIPIVSIGFR